MATYNGNNYYVLFDSVNISAYVQEADIDASNAVQDTSVGSGSTHTKSAAGLDTYSCKFVISHDSAGIPSYIQKLKPGATILIEFGIEGNTAGQPRHVQNFIIEKAPTKTDVTKKMVTYDVSGKGADAPSVNMYAGGTY